MSAIQKSKPGIFGIFQKIPRVISLQTADFRDRVTRTLFKRQDGGRQNQSPLPQPPRTLGVVLKTTETLPIDTSTKSTVVQQIKEAVARDTSQKDKSFNDKPSLATWKLDFSKRTEQEAQPILEEPSILTPPGRTSVRISTPSSQSKEQSTSKKTDYTYLALRRQSVTRDVWDSLISIVPFFPKKKVLSTQENLIASFERYIVLHPELINSPHYRLIKEGLEDISSQIPRAREMEFYKPETIEDRPRLPFGYSDILRIHSNLNTMELQIFKQPLGAITKPFSSIVQKGVGTIGRNVVSSTGVASRGVVGGALRGLGGVLTRTVLPRIAVFLGGLAASGLGIPVGVLVFIIVLVIAVPVVLVIISSSQIGSFTGATGGASYHVSPGSQYISILATATPRTLKNEELPKIITYVIKVRPKEEVLSKVQVRAVVSGSNKDGTRTMDTKNWEIEKIEKNSEWVETYTVEVSSQFSDSNIANAISVSSEVVGQTARQSDTAVIGVKVGNPPDNCPSGWPTEYGRITQGPDTSSGTHKGAQAIDIGNTGTQRIVGATIRATHSGKTESCGSSLYGICIKIKSSCGGRDIFSLYAHMQSRSVGEGQIVNQGTELGRVGATGNVYGDDPNHLHYEFDPNFPIVPPYIPTLPNVGTSW